MGLTRAAVIAALGVFVTSCTASSYDLMKTGSISASAMQTPFADSDPVDFGKITPAHYPIHGVDVSRWQGDVDWAKAHRHGVSFAFVKATEGGDRLDPRFDDYWKGARAAGIAVAPYHFYYFCTSPEQQARWFIQNVPKRSLGMPPVLDMEWNAHSPTCHRRPDPATVRADVKRFSAVIASYYGVKPIIYTTVDFHETNLDGYFADLRFWLRSVADHPDNVYHGRDWTFWQYTGTGIVPGIRGKADLNVFDGDVDAWKTWLSSATN
ncbi:glycoside hydrolase family 25 protein [Pararhizobium mangrovi]|uniref:Glycoside hydrolase family 25 protein n=1 Tax=Pararhizobium mangrovi TaxID=2590452 RepID=A0A506UBX6_9HYPH|nr:GH25 family lysozyme [Pararhizobium mangrovi]TPW30335.1 glycoside hydrolase family 25 protein [Pararhizobium mangrovi]